MTVCHASRVGRGQELVPKQIKRLGWKPDTPDMRDHLLQITKYRAPLGHVDLRQTRFMPPVYDQGDLGSCTANAVAGAYEYVQKKSGLPDYTPSRLFIYYGERVLEHSVSEDSGAELRDGL